MIAPAAALAVALILDLVVGEPPDVLHPVAWFGRLVGLAERDWRRPRLVGVALAGLLPLSVAAGLGLMTWAIAASSRPAGVLFAALVVFVAASYRSLLMTVRGVSTLAGTDVDAARRELRALAGREAGDLDAGRIRSAALESLGENLSDGLVAPLSAFAVGALVAKHLGLSPAWTLGLGCAGATWIKAVNTMDSMWGYPDRPLGTGAARLDDLAMWLPARLTAGLLAAVFLAPASLGRAADWLDGVPSPNAGWPMGVLAAALDVRLEKPGSYRLNADADLPAPTDVRRGVRRVGVAGLIAYALAGVVVWS